MIQRDYLIIGAGIGGASACEAIRKHDKRGSVTLVGSEAYAPYKRWLLSKSFLREKTILPKKYSEIDERWYAAHKIDARFNTAVTQLNIDRRVAGLGNGESIEFNKACLAMGSRPGRPPVAGVGLGNVIYLRTMRDGLALREMAEHEKTVMVVGGGLLACEVAASLRQMKMKVSVMHRHSMLLNRYLDPETAMWVTTKAIQIHGGYGYSREYPVERAYRDIRGLCIGAGTVEAQRNYIGGAVSKGRTTTSPGWVDALRDAT